MEIFKNKFLVKLIASICLFLTLLNFGSASKVYADDASWGGVLISPIISLMTALGDGINSIIHKAIQHQEETLIKINGDDGWTKFWKTVAIIIGAIVIAVAFVVAASATMGLANAAVAAIAGGSFTFSMAAVSGGMLAGGAAVGIWVGIVVGNTWFKEDIYLPVFTVSAEEIFSNQINLFDVNFFTPMEDQVVETRVVGTETVKNEKSIGIELTDASYKGLPLEAQAYHDTSVYEIYAGERYESPAMQKVIDTINNDERFIEKITTTKPKDTKDTQWTMRSNMLQTTLEDESWIYGGTIVIYKDWNAKYIVITFDRFTTVTVVQDSEDVNIMDLADKLADADFYSDSNEDFLRELLTISTETIVEKTEDIKVESTAKQLQKIVSTWYFILRNIALLVLMLVLIYSGIRIVIGSTAGEKAKYKERLMDWLVALCLIMVMHYIMVFAVNIVSEITELVNKANDKGLNAAYIPLNDTQYDNAKDLDWSKFGGVDNVIQKQDGTVPEVAKADSGYVLVWQTNLMGLFRIQAQLEEKGTAEWVGYAFCYVVLVLFTAFFAFTYVKRVIYMAFLTMIAPLVAMTYPIDKITDGKAQAFDAWLKEYIFNLMIQPLHLLLYTILVTSAFELASTNAIYALCAIGFMMPAEKLMRRFFGFEKAKTPGLLGGAAGAALAMTGLQNILKPKHHPKDGNNSNVKTKDQNKVNYQNRNSVNTMEAVMDGEELHTPTTNIPNTDNDSNITEGYHPGLTDEQRDDMIAEGIKPGDQEYDQMLMQFGLNPNDAGSSSAIDSTDETTNGGIEDEIDDTFLDTSDEAQTDQSTKSKRSIKGAVGAVAKGIGRDIGMAALKGIHPLRLAGKVAAGATAGTAGLLLGIASGDPSKAFQYTTAGAMAGSALAGSLSGNKLGDAERLKEEAEMAYYGEDYKKHQIEKQNRAFQKDKANINYIRQTMGKSEEEARSILATTGEQCFNNGITNIEDIATIHQLTHGSNSMSFNQAVAARDYATKRLPSDTDKMTARTIQQHKDRWANEFKDKYQNLSKKQAEALADKSFELAIRYNKAKSGLTKMS